jgi:RNA polymerase sigma factor (sigma-70 family)
MPAEVGNHRGRRMENDTTSLVQRVQAGEESAKADLVAHTCCRLESLAHQFLRGFPVVRRWEETGDVLQKALLRLCKALDEVQLESVAHFYKLASLQIRRELIDLARHYSGPEGLAANHHTDNPENSLLAQKTCPNAGPSSAGEWGELHQAVERLPDDERAVLDLTVYQGFSQKEAGAILGVDQRTIRRRLQSARCRLDKALKPDDEGGSGA